MKLFLDDTNPCKKTFRSEFLPLLESAGYTPHVPWPITYQVSLILNKGGGRGRGRFKIKFSAVKKSLLCQFIEHIQLSCSGVQGKIYLQAK